MTFRQLGTPSSTPAKIVLFDVPLPVPADLEGHRREMLASLAWIECDGATQGIEYVSLGLASALQANRYTRKSLRAVDRLVTERLRAHMIVSKMVLVRMLLYWKHTAVQKDGFEQQEANGFRQAFEKLIDEPLCSGLESSSANQSHREYRSSIHHCQLSRG